MPERIPYIIPDHARYSVRIFQIYIYIYICVIPTMFCHGGDHSNLFFSVRVMRNTQRTVKSQERAQNFEQKMGTDHGPNLNLASMYHGQWPIQTDVLLILTSEIVTMTGLKSKSHPTEKQPWMNKSFSSWIYKHNSQLRYNLKFQPCRSYKHREHTLKVNPLK